MRPGDTVDRYVVEAQLAVGPAPVFRVRHETLGTRRALKLGPGDATVAARLREGRLQAALDHPNLVGVVDVLEVEGQPALLLEYVEGPTLQDVLQDAPPRLEDALRIFREVLAGVAHAHAGGLVHRDLCPANVLLDVTRRPPVARIADFGAARPTAGPGSREGTPGYCAPEQLRGAEVAATADVFALGVLLFELCAGRRPFPQVDREQLLAAMEAGRHEPLPGHLPAGVGRVVEACLAPEPRDRPADAAALQALLDAPAEVEVRRSWGGHVAWAAVVVGVFAWGLGQRAQVGEHSDQAEVAGQQLAAAELLYEAARVRDQDPATAMALLRAVTSLRGEDRVPEREAAALLFAGAATLRLDQPGALTVRVDLSDELVALADDRPGVRVLRRATGETVAELDSEIRRPGRLALDDEDRWLVLSAPGAAAEAVSPVVAWGLPEGRPLVSAPATPAWAYARGGTYDEVLVVHEQASGGRRAELRQLPEGEVLWQREVPAGQTAVLASTGVVVPGEQWELTGRDGEVLRRFARDKGPTLSPDGSAWALRGEGAGLVVHDDAGERVAFPEAAARIAWSTDGAWLAAVDGDEFLHAVRVSDGARASWSAEVPARAVVARSEGFLVGTSQGGVYSWTPQGESRPYRGLRSRVISMVEQGVALAASDLEGRAALWQDPHRHPGTTSRVQAAGAVWSGSDAHLVALDPPRRLSSEGGEDLSVLAGEVVEAHVVRDRLVLLDGQGGARVHDLPPAVQVRRRGVARVEGGTLVATVTGVVLLDDSGAVAHREPLVSVGRLVPWDGDRALVSHGTTAAVSVVDARGRLVQTLHAESEQAISALAPDGEELVAATFCGRVFRFEGGEGIELAALGSPVSALASRDAVVVAGTWDGRVVAIGADGPRWTWTLGRQIVDLAWVGDVLVAADEDGLLTWLSAQGEVLAVRQGHLPGKVRLRGGDALWSHGADGVLLSWDTERVTAVQPTLAHTGSWSNLRVCRGDGRVVPVMPWPDDETVWAPDEACG